MILVGVAPGRHAPRRRIPDASPWREAGTAGRLSAVPADRHPESPARRFRAPHPRARSLRDDDLPPLRTQWDPTPPAVPGALAQLRRRQAPHHSTRHHPHRVRPGHHSLRPGQQLRPPLRVGGTQLRSDPEFRPGRAPRRTHHLDQGRLGHVARPVRRTWIPQVLARQPRPEPGPAGAGLRRHLLLPPVRPRDPLGRDHGCVAYSRPVRARPVCRDLVVQPAAHP